MVSANAHVSKSRRVLAARLGPGGARAGASNRQRVLLCLLYAIRRSGYERDAGIHNLVHGPVGRRQVHDRRPRDSRARAPRSGGRAARRRRRAHAPLEGPRLLQGGPRHQHPAHRLGLEPHHAPRRRHRRLGDLALRGDAPGRARARRGVRAVRVRARARLGRRVRPPRHEGPLREGDRRRDQGVHGHQRSRTRSPTSPELTIDTESESPEESAARVVDYLEQRGLVKAAVAA